MVTDFVATLDMPSKEGKYLNFTSLANVETLEGLEGIVFFATPDVMTGLISWCLMDTMKLDAVSVPFASGCSAIIGQTVTENRDGGYRTFLGLFDPSVRPMLKQMF